MIAAVMSGESTGTCSALHVLVHLEHAPDSLSTFPLLRQDYFGPFLITYRGRQESSLYYPRLGLLDGYDCGVLRFYVVH
jgi:hypothetical protein